MTKPPVPKGLEAPGRALWRLVQAKYELRIDENTVLEAAARVVDTVSRLDSAIAGEPLTVRGSAGQMREHPLLSEARQQRALLARLLHQLRLPEEDELAGMRSDARSVQARKAARSRWTQAHGEVRHRGA